MIFIHKYCGNEFENSPDNHLSKKQGCPYCFSPSKRGKYRSIKSGKMFKFDSLWELERMKYFDTELNILKWDRCQDKIPYFDMESGRCRTYHPDFELNYLDGTIVVRK